MICVVIFLPFIMGFPRIDVGLHNVLRAWCTTINWVITFMAFLNIVVNCQCLYLTIFSKIGQLIDLI